MTKTLRRLFLLACLSGMTTVAVAQADSYPTRPVRIVVPFSPGGPVDAIARAIAAKLTEQWGRQVIVENKGGAATIIGWDTVAKAPADGYTVLLAGAGGRTTLPSVATLPFDPAKDLVAVAAVARSPNVFVVNSALGKSTLPEFVSYAKAKPGGLNHGLSAPGTITQFVATLLARDAGLKWEDIPYRGGAPAVTALMAGEIDMLTADLGAVLAMEESGKLKILAVADTQRSPLLSQVPTATEAGFPNVVAVNVYGVFAPSGTPKPILRKFSDALAQIVAQPGLKEQFAKLGLQIDNRGSDAFEAFLRTQTSQWAPIAKASGVRIN
ncbi:Bug family tripartite tricarboxylate transporter substrate binding protein [Variovorax terrae]|uniref:Tripartite tricarboxylate transporter substrate binding protein n=1 Tax=Variovorax terrae TaxID=2923278 RepID=A0A9X2AP32_9BURK|nr:tripartite tricarboxylate transporter substrate binding protein [Variovorax terrae]MCJ0761616.1 tripartite tricarboxylate transporter substrate binding protein [Variovorax terrae]